MALLTPQQLERARRLRRMDTGCEQRLWAQLRGRRLGDFKFVRQLPVGHYVADFACRERALIIEVDGATHSTDEDAAYDARRTEYLEDSGWRVLRVMNDDVVRRMEDVLEMILRSMAR
jgi:very-short-patch-repair endonuclease